MKTFHMHVRVEDLDASIKFYGALFGAAPTKTKDDYAKWMLEDPRVNFAISTRGGEPGLDHVGIQSDDEEGLEELRGRLSQAEIATFDEGQTTCCYAESDKTWASDPSGIAWETYRTMAEAEVYGAPTKVPSSGCCAPSPESAPSTPAATSCC